MKKLKIRSRKAPQRPKDLSLIRRSDKLLGIAFVAALVVCLGILFVLSWIDDMSITEMALLLSAPFFLAGLFVYVEYKKWFVLIILLAVDIALYLAKIDPMMVFLFSFVFIGAAGVVGIVVLLQRLMFYRVVGIVEYINVKDKLSIWDKAVTFFFSVPNDLDTRTVTINYNLKRASIPWNEMAQTIMLGLMIGMFLWIYILMNPGYMDPGTINDTPATLFMLVLYIPLLVLPWSIFKSLNVRVETRYRDFTLYDGIKETLKRMALPMMAACLFILIAITETSITDVVLFIVLLVIFNVVILGLTSLFFYLLFEAPLVDDIVSKWKTFRPVAITMDIGNDIKMDDDVPATPRRDLKDYGKLEFPDKR